MPGGLFGYDENPEANAGPTRCDTTTTARSRSVARRSTT